MTHHIMTNLDKPQIELAIETAKLRLTFQEKERHSQWYEVRPFAGETAAGDIWVLAPQEDIRNRDFEAQRKIYDKIVRQIGQFRDPDAKNIIVQVFFADDPHEYTKKSEECAKGTFKVSLTDLHDKSKRPPSPEEDLLANFPGRCFSL